MFRILVILMIVVPAIEIWGIIKASQWIGGWQTFLLIIGTGGVGAFLAKREGLKVWNLARIRMSQGEIPGDAILDGLSIFAGGLLLLTPGFLTDTVGFLLVLPVSRFYIKKLLLKKIWRMMQNGTFSFYYRR
jgi:UPF0716 protein FxsA